MKINWNLSIILLLLISSCTSTLNQSEQGWKIVYRNDKNGTTINGDKMQLINAVRNGLPVRIGFGRQRPNDPSKSIEHIVNAHFLTVANGAEVFAQIQPIIGQAPDLNSDTLKIAFRPGWSWTTLVGTNGYTNSLMVNSFQDTIIGNNLRTTGVSWFVNLSGGGQLESNGALYEN